MVWEAFMEHKIRIETSSLSLHIMAMAFMLCDHLWGTIIPGNDWLTCIGRISFPLFAFMIVEGYFCLQLFLKYRLTLPWAAVCSIPSTKMYYGVF